MTAQLRVAALAAALLLAPTMAYADVKILASAQGWDAFGGTTTNGTAVCGISKDFKTKYFSVKLFSGRDTITMQLSNKDWPLQPKAEYDVTMTFDRNKPWRATGVGFQFNDGDMGIEYTIRRQELAEFNREFVASSAVVLHLAKPGAQSWTIDLSGVDDVRHAYVTCSNELK